MNFKQLESARKLRGGYYTPAPVAAFLLRWAVRSGPCRVLEPGCGDGAFLRAAAHLDVDTRFLAFEIEPGEAAAARAAASGVSRVIAGDFLSWATGPGAAERFDAAVGNPPYVRYQYLDAGQQAAAERLFAREGVPFTRHTNLWVSFVLAAVAALRPGGRLAMVVPAELLHVLHARGLREHLLAACAEVVVVDVAPIVFEGTLQGTVLLLAEKARSNGTGRLSLVRADDLAFLAESPESLLGRSIPIAGADLDYKWMAALLEPAERQLLEQLSSAGLLRDFSAFGRVDVGIVTGANKFFLVDDATVAMYSLQAYCKPMFGRSEHARGVIYGWADHAENARRGHPTHFLDFSGGAPPAYIALGERQGLHARYKCRIRDPWYRVPSVYAARIGMLKRCHHFPKLLLNEIGAYTTDTAYRIASLEEPAESIVARFVNSATALSAELLGRHYGGGVLELVPSEIERLLLPAVDPAGDLDLAGLDADMRSASPPEEVLARRDARVLGPLGVSGEDQERLRAAWDRLRSRRQRVTTPDTSR
ncbi:MAG: N-6 DNA methylase [Candidatus Sericytochromatia bacterium]|nr:N-6 DNA methylase [Candidatus Tanganyikabacteria bacterium]